MLLYVPPLPYREEVFIISCKHPLTAVDLGFQVNGKKNIKIINIFEADKYPKDKIIKLPCGQCVDCRLEYSRQWANRCMLELQYHDSSYFVTLTYDDAHVPKSYYSDPETGEAFESLTLQKRDFQLFMKRLRKKFSDQKIRFFMAGEYGDETKRPHYHAILFGLHLDDLQHYKKSQLGFSYFNSPSLSEVWSDNDGNPIGHVVIAPVTWETCAYTARYVMKKLNGDLSQFYSDFNLQPEFTLMSRKPGIARQYYDDHPDLYQYDKINLKTEKGGRTFKPPRYYDKLYSEDNPEEMQRIKDIRKEMATEAEKAKLQRTSLFAEELLEVEEQNQIARLKSLRRNL